MRKVFGNAITVLYRNNCIPIIAYHIIARTSRIAYQKMIDNQIATSYAFDRCVIIWYIFEIGFGVGCFFVFCHSRGGRLGALGPGPPGMKENKKTTNSKSNFKMYHIIAYLLIA